MFYFISRIIFLFCWVVSAGCDDSLKRLSVTPTFAAAPSSTGRCRGTGGLPRSAGGTACFALGTACTARPGRTGEPDRGGSTCPGTTSVLCLRGRHRGGVCLLFATESFAGMVLLRRVSIYGRMNGNGWGTRVMCFLTAWLASAGAWMVMARGPLIPAMSMPWGWMPGVAREGSSQFRGRFGQDRIQDQRSQSTPITSSR